MLSVYFHVCNENLVVVCSSEFVDTTILLQFYRESLFFSRCVINNENLGIQYYSLIFLVVVYDYGKIE